MPKIYGTDPKGDKDKRCEFCNKKLGEYRRPRERVFAQQHVPIRIKCPRCKKIS